MKDQSILIRNVYYMLSYAFRSLQQDLYKDVAAESFDEMYSMLAAILSKGIGMQLKQGLYREYVRKQEELPGLRGKINLPGTVRNRLSHKQVLNCEYDELSENNRFNQILKTTVMLLLRKTEIKEQYRESLKKEMLYFSCVDLVEPTEIRWSELRFHRNNQTYRMLLGICMLILEGMVQTTEDGQLRMAAFVDEQRMCRLYEKFILEYYRTHFSQLHPKAAQIPWALDDGMDTMLPVMQSDIHLEKDGIVLIIDAKYYGHTTQVQFDRHTIHSANLYQIFTYVKNRHYEFGNTEHRVSGMLLYARTEEQIQPDAEFQMHGSRISVRTLDLNQPFEQIARQLNEIAQRYFP